MWPRSLPVAELPSTSRVMEMTWCFASPDGRATLQIVRVDDDRGCPGAASKTTRGTGSPDGIRSSAKGAPRGVVSAGPESISLTPQRDGGCHCPGRCRRHGHRSSGGACRRHRHDTAARHDHRACGEPADSRRRRAGRRHWPTQQRRPRPADSQSDSTQARRRPVPSEFPVPARDMPRADRDGMAARWGCSAVRV